MNHSTVSPHVRQDTQLLLFDFDTPSMPVLDVDRCYVKPVNHFTAAQMVTKYHYAHRTPSIVASFGMYVDDVLAGVITYGVPSQRNVLLCCGDEYEKNALELNRLFIHDWAGRNSESWLIGQSFQWLAKTHSEIKILVSYADTEQGHHGMIYRATNWLYTGMSSTEGNLLINGSKMHPRTVFDQFGTRNIETLKTRGVIVERTNVAGKHRYVYFLGDKRQRKILKQSLKWDILPYPQENKNAAGTALLDAK